MKSLLQHLVVLAYLLGDGPADKVPPETREGWEALAAFDVANELCEPRDLYAGWRAEMKWARSEYREARAYPRLAQLALFPPPEEISRRLSFGLEYEAKHPGDGECLGAWLLLESCYRGRFKVDRRRKLAELREKLGSEAYYAGVLPPPAPLWKFRDRSDP